MAEGNQFKASNTTWPRPGWPPAPVTAHARCGVQATTRAAHRHGEGSVLRTGGRGCPIWAGIPHGPLPVSVPTGNLLLHAAGVRVAPPSVANTRVRKCYSWPRKCGTGLPSAGTHPCTGAAAQTRCPGLVVGTEYVTLPHYQCSPPPQWPFCCWPLPPGALAPRSAPGCCLGRLGLVCSRCAYVRRAVWTAIGGVYPAARCGVPSNLVVVDSALLAVWC